jgi:MFS family permease
MSRDARESQLFYGYVVTAAGFSIWFIGWGTFTPCFGVFFKPLLNEFGWSRAATTLAYSLSFMVQACVAIAMGWLTDRLGPRAVLTVFGSFVGISYVLLSQITALWQFQICYALVGGIGISTITVPVMATVSRWFIKRRGLMIGIVQAGVSIGGFLFPPFSVWLILAHGWRTAYAILGIIALVGIIGAGLFLRRDPRDEGLWPDGVREKTIEDITQAPPPSLNPGFSLGEAIRTSRFWIMAGLYGSFGFCRTTFIAHIAIQVQDLGFTLLDGANVLAVLTAASVIGRIGMGRVADKIGNRPAFIMSFAATAIILVWGLIAHSLWGLYLFALVFGFGWGGQAVLRFALTSEVFGVVSLGLLMGVFGFAESGAATFGSYFAGHIFDVTGTYQQAFWAGIVISVVGIVLAWLLKSPERRAM